MKAYISGPVTGRPIEEVENNFGVTERWLRSRGYEPVNPLKLPHNEGDAWQDCMLRDLEALRHCDACYMLPGWTKSYGCIVEYLFATRAGLEVYTDCRIWRRTPENGVARVEAGPEDSKFYIIISDMEIPDGDISGRGG